MSLKDIGRKAKLARIYEAFCKDSDAIDKIYSTLWPENPFDRLPEEILCEIIYFVPPDNGDKYAVTARVCKKWREIWLSEKSKITRLRYFFRNMVKFNPKTSCEKLAVYKIVPELFALEISRVEKLEEFRRRKPKELSVIMNPIDVNMVLEPVKSEHDIPFDNEKKRKRKEIWDESLQSSMAGIGPGCLCQDRKKFDLALSKEIRDQPRQDVYGEVHIESKTMLPYLTTVVTLKVLNTSTYCIAKYDDLVQFIMEILEKYVQEPSKFGEFEKIMLHYQDMFLFC